MPFFVCRGCKPGSKLLHKIFIFNNHCTSIHSATHNSTRPQLHIIVVERVNQSCRSAAVSVPAIQWTHHRVGHHRQHRVITIINPRYYNSPCMCHSRASAWAYYCGEWGSMCRYVLGTKDGIQNNNIMMAVRYGLLLYPYVHTFHPEQALMCGRLFIIITSASISIQWQQPGHAPSAIRAGYVLLLLYHGRLGIETIRDQRWGGSGLMLLVGNWDKKRHTSGLWLVKCGW